MPYCPVFLWQITQKVNATKCLRVSIRTSACLRSCVSPCVCTGARHATGWVGKKKKKKRPASWSHWAFRAFEVVLFVLFALHSQRRDVGISKRANPTLTPGKLLSALTGRVSPSRADPPARLDSPPSWTFLTSPPCTFAAPRLVEQPPVQQTRPAAGNKSISVPFDGCHTCTSFAFIIEFSSAFLEKDTEKIKNTYRT